MGRLTDTINELPNKHKSEVGIVDICMRLLEFTRIEEIPFELGEANENVLPLYKS